MRTWITTAALLVAGCGGTEDEAPPPDAADAAVPDAAVPDAGVCADRDPLRRPLFGDLHVHTAYSFDAWVFGTRADPAGAYAFARGAEMPGPDGAPMRLARALDFAAVTDHGEFLGEVSLCLTPGAPGYDSADCVGYRAGNPAAYARFAVRLTNTASRRPDVCHQPGVDCLAEARTAWDRVRAAAAAADDPCRFTTFVGYEWTGNTAGRNLHRNVIFRDARVPEAPVTYFEAHTAAELWDGLESTCLNANTGCDVLAIPHNSNLSNGGMFRPEPNPDDPREAERAARRAALEPLVEVVQHKGASECNEGFATMTGEADELCAFEAMRPPPFDDCGEGVGSFGIQRLGCVSRYDYVRDVLLTGLGEEARIGANPYRLGMIGSTDTHIGAAGATDEATWRGHGGDDEATPADRLRDDIGLPYGIVANPGGLAGVWAEENTRDAIFAALRRRETWATSGTRIVPRFFAGRGLPADLCGDPDLVARADAAGVPMGGTLPAGDGPPTFVVAALRDPDPGAAPLERLQIVKGWIDAEGRPHHVVHEVARGGDSDVDPETCERRGDGPSSLCAVFTDPDFDPSRPAFWYVRVVEAPSCRWSRLQCLALPEADRPAACADPNVPRTVREMAWTSPVWHTPPR
jgi:hypothetical protein